VAEIMTPAPLKTVSPRTDVGDALRILAERDLHQLPVVEHGGLVGLLTRADIMRFLQVRRDLDLRGREEQRRERPIAA
jgi:CBS domain-containing protein